MKKVDRKELLGLAEYEQIRQPFFTRMIVEKRDRRLVVSGEVSVVFENHDTVLFQIQEMLRTERISKEPAILHELETYNELVPESFELSATMFIEIAEKEERERRLVELAGLENHIALEVLGTKVPAQFEERAVLPDRTVAVHYLKFSLGEPLSSRFIARAKENPENAAFYVLDHPRLSAKKALLPAMIKSLAEDLAS